MLPVAKNDPRPWPRLVACLLLGLAIGGLWGGYPNTLLTAWIVLATLLFLGSSSNETRSTNQDAACRANPERPDAGPGHAETPGGESGVPADQGKAWWMPVAEAAEELERVIDERDQYRERVGEYMLVYKEIEGLERWWESYPHETAVERVRAVGDSCSYWHSVSETALDERNEAWAALEIAAKDKSAALDTRRAARKILKKDKD